MKVSFKLALLVAFIPFTQLYVRFIHLKGSLDKLWTLIPVFMVPPFSFVPAVMMYMGKIKPGIASPAYDKYAAIAILGSLIIRLLNDFDVIPQSLIIQFFVTIILPVIIGTITFYVRNTLNCKKTKTPGGPSRESKVDLMRSFQSGVVLTAFGTIIPFMLGFVPFFKSIINVLSMIPIIGTILTTILEGSSIFIVYVLINMINSKEIFTSVGSKTFKTFSMISGIGMVMLFFLSDTLSKIPLLGLLISCKKPGKMLNAMKGPVFNNAIDIAHNEDMDD